MAPTVLHQIAMQQLQLLQQQQQQITQLLLQQEQLEHNVWDADKRAANVFRAAQASHEQEQQRQNILIKRTNSRQ